MSSTRAVNVNVPFFSFQLSRVKSIRYTFLLKENYQMEGKSAVQLSLNQVKLLLFESPSEQSFKKKKPKKTLII